MDLKNPLSILIFYSFFFHGSCEFLYSKSKADEHFSFQPKKIAFGSCSKQYKNQPVWDQLIKDNIEAFFWTGDAVYVNGSGSPFEMKHAFELQLQNKNYTKFLKSNIKVDGVWDDHDFGINDAGKDIAVHDLPERLKVFQDFLQLHPDSPRRQRNGLYSSTTFGEPPQQVKVILLDVRSHRDPYVLDVGARNGMYWALVSAFARALSAALGIAKKQTGDILGAEQWEWLESQLAGSEASAHIIVSSVQIFTTSPFVESWAYFPAARKRLLSVLSKYQPLGTLFVSGDVHLAERLSGILKPTPKCQANEVRGERKLLEVTSSGMTHSVSTSWYGPYYSEIKCSSFPDPVYEKTYFEKNYLTVDFDWPGSTSAACNKCPSQSTGEVAESSVDKSCEVMMQISIKSIQGEVIFQESLSSCQRLSTTFLECIDDEFPKTTIRTISKPFIFAGVLALACAAFCILGCHIIFRTRRKSIHIE